MHRTQYETHSPEETREMGHLLGTMLKNFQYQNKHAFVIALLGDLGSGKTAFVQGFARGIGIKRVVQSPTFVFMKRYLITSRKFRALWHVDCYRTKSRKDFVSIGFGDILNNPKNIILVEWANKITRLLPHDRLTIHFFHKKGDTRQITIRYAKDR